MLALLYSVCRSLKASQLSTVNEELKAWSWKLLLCILLSTSARKHKALAIQMNMRNSKQKAWAAEGYKNNSDYLMFLFQMPFFGSEVTECCP